MNLSEPWLELALFSRLAIRSRMLGELGRAELGDKASVVNLLGTGRGPRVATAMDQRDDY